MSPPSVSVSRLTNPSSFSGDDCRLLIASVTDYAIFMLDPAGRVTSWNAGAAAVAGYDAAEILGEHVSAFYTAEDVAAGIPARELEMARDHGRMEADAWRIRKDGTPFWANVVMTALRDEHGNLRGYGNVVKDLTDRHVADEKLREAEQRFHSLVDAVTDYAIFMLDADGNVASWNSGARKAKGYEANEIIGRHFSVFYTPEDRDNGKPARVLDAVRRTGRFEDEGWRVRKDGTRFWANVVVTALRNDAGQLIGFAKVTRDLTERRAAEEQLRHSEERFRLLVESVTGYAIYQLDTSGHVVTWNLGAERMKGYPAAEILGQHFRRFFPEEDVKAGRPERELEIAAREGRFSDEGWRVRKDGTRFWAYVFLAPVRDGDGHLIGYAKVTQDLTARRQAEQTERQIVREQAAREAAQRNADEMRRIAHAAEDAAKRAAEANRFKDMFLATVSHELRTPLNAILGYAGFLRAYPSDANAIAKAIDVIYRNAEAQAKIIEDILDVSRIVSGKLHLDMKTVRPQGIIAEAIEVVRPSAIAKRLAIDVSAKDDAGATLLVADADRLRQVVWNLLSNAVKFTEPGGMIHVGLERDGSKLVITVRDTGCGIEQEFLPYVFERFQQADSSTTRRFGGLGLGLAIVRHIVELHGGQVFATSGGKGRGSSFRVVLPIRAVSPEAGEVVDPTPSGAASYASISPEPAVSGVRVLVVDDDADARGLLSDVLGRAGATVETAASAALGLAAVRRFRPDVVVSDIGMPDEDGYSFVTRLRALPRDQGGRTPSIALTAYTRSEDRTRALAAGFTTHVGKPVNPSDLVAAVANLASIVR